LVSDLKLKAIEVIRRGLDDSEPRIRANAIEVAASMKQDELMPKVQRLLKDDYVPVRYAAALAVGDMRYNSAVDTLKLLLRDPDSSVRLSAAYALGKLGQMESLSYICRGIRSSDQVVRANAVVILGKSGDKRALDFLHEAKNASDSDDKVRFQAAEAIARLGDESIYPRLWTMLISFYADDRVMGIKAMGALGSKKARDALIGMLGDDILEVRLVAAEQLGLLGISSGEPEVLDVFAKNLTSDMDRVEAERVQILTALAIGRIGTPRLTEYLPKLLRNRSKLVRIAAAKAVLQCANKR
jgi:HEAT repeat protein